MYHKGCLHPPYALIPIGKFSEQILDCDYWSLMLIPHYIYSCTDLKGEVVLGYAHKHHN